MPTLILGRKNRGRRKIFDYNQKKLENPFYSKKKKIADFSNLKNKIILALCLLALIGLGWFTAASSYWKIKEVAINGLDRMSNDEILKMVNQQLSGRNWLIMPQKNLLFFNQEKFLKSAQEKYRFQNIQIKKQWPNKLIIDIREKTLACVWNEADKYYLSDSDGYILSEVSPLDLGKKSYPLISNESGSLINGDKIQIDASYISSVANLFGKLAQKAAMEIIIDRFIIDKDLNTIKLVTAEGVKVFFNTESDFDRQIEKLLLLKKERLGDEFKNKKYIDLRFDNKIYFQ